MGGDDDGAVRLEARGVPGTSWTDVMEEMGRLGWCSGGDRGVRVAGCDGAAEEGGVG